ncbi:MAG: phospholipid carrier-dependent glycosyltransferase [Acidobacteriia bacterium]|nr:phospholipid carrier-dependent glycosyltransferase [Terriglobia bacterium]
MPGRVASSLWLTWIVALALLTAGVFRWHLDYFSSPGPQFYRLALILVPGLALAAWIYSGIRGKALWRWEPALLAILIAAAALRYEPRACLVAAAVFLSCCATGNFALRRLRLKLENPIDRITLGFGAGAGILITVLFLAGLLRLFYSATFLVILLLPLILFWRETRATLIDLGTLPARWRASDALRHPLTGVAVLFGLVAATCSLMIVLAPSVAFDSVAIHLPSVQYYAGQHALRPVPGLAYSYYPQGFEMLWTLAYALAGQPGAQMISALFFPLFLLILVRLGRECGLDQGAAVLAAVGAATLPFLHWSGSVMKNDLALAFFELLGIYAFLLWRRHGDFRWIAAGAFFLAQAIGVKYVALFGALPLIVLFGYAVWRQTSRWKAALTIAAVLAVFGAGWAVRAYLLTGNPIAPSRLSVTVPGSLQRRPLSTAERALRYIETPWRLTFHGQDSFESPLESPAGILLFAFAPLAILGGRLRPRTSAQWACVIFTVVYLAYWALILTKVRYAIAPFALLAALMAAWMKSFYDSQSGRFGKLVKMSVIGVATYGFLIGTMGFMIVGVNGPQFAYFAGRLDQPGYLRAAMQAYGAVEFITKTGTKAGIYAVDNEARGYAPNPFAFQALWCSGGTPCSANRVVAGARKSGAEYLIFPESRPVPEEALERLGRPARVYRDQYFSVYHLSR